MHNLLDFCGRSPRTKLMTALRACSTASSGLLMWWEAVVGTAGAGSCLVEAVAGFLASVVVDTVYVVVEDNDGSTDEPRMRDVA
jgi:hypothetical protein